MLHSSLRSSGWLIQYGRRTAKKASFSTSDVATIFILRFRFAVIKTSSIPYQVCDGGRRSGRTPARRFEGSSSLRNTASHTFLQSLHISTLSSFTTSSFLLMTRQHLKKLLFDLQKCVMVVVVPRAALDVMHQIETMSSRLLQYRTNVELQRRRLFRHQT